MTAYEKNRLVLNTIQKIAPAATMEDAATLRRAALVIHRWAEHECNGVIQRDEETNIPYYHSSYDGKRYGRTPDREAGAIERIKQTCERLKIYHYIQGDPRGGTLYVSNKPIPDNNYNRAVFVA